MVECKNCIHYKPGWCSIYADTPEVAIRDCADHGFGWYHSLTKTRTFRLAQTVFIVERDESGYAVSIGVYKYIAPVKQAVLVLPSDNREIDPDEFISDLLYQTVDEETTGICAFPQEDCYPTFEQASRAQDLENARKDDE